MLSPSAVAQDKLSKHAYGRSTNFAIIRTLRLRSGCFM